MQRAALASLLFLSMLLTPAHAQRDTTARLTGTVRSSINGLPVSGVMIAVKGSRVVNVSDSTGSFTLVGLPGGRQTVRILYGDSLSYEKEMDLKQGKTLTLSVLLDVAATELAPIVVEAQTLSAERSLAGFRSEEHTSELQSHSDLVCRLLLEKKKKNITKQKKQKKEHHTRVRQQHYRADFRHQPQGNAISSAQLVLQLKSTQSASISQPASTI